MLAMAEATRSSLRRSRAEQVGHSGSPDGKMIAFVNSANPEDLAKQAAAQKPPAAPSRVN